MPVYKLQGPDGKVYTVEGPEGATADQLGAFITQANDDRASRIAADRERMRAEMDPTKDMSTLDKVRAGAGKAFADLGRGAGQLVGLVDRADVADSRATDAALMNTTAGKVGNFAGNVALAAPTALIPGANTITGAAAIGAGAGLLQPSTSTGETLRNVGIGGVAGAAVPAAIVAGKTAKSFVEPLYQGGRDKIVGRAVSEAAGGDNAALIAALRGNKSAVPGVQYTAAEAAQNPSLAAMQRTATQTNPVVMNEAAARQAANNEARVAVLQDLAGTQGQREFYDAARKSAANELYEKAYKAGLPTFTPEQQAIVSDLMTRPAIKGGHMSPGAMDSARTLAKNEGVDVLDAAGSVKGLDYVKRALDDKISTATGNEQRVLMGIKEKLVGLLDEVSPQYAEARRTFQAMSKPINQMDTIEAVNKAAIDPLTGSLRPAAFARVLRDDTARSATGFRGATLENTLTPEARGTLSSVQDDLARQQFAQNAGRAGSDTVQKLAYSNMMNQAGVPSLVRNFGPAGIVGSLMERGGNIVYNDANKKLSEQLARALLNPEEAASLVSGAAVSPRSLALADALRRAGAVGAASAPALVQGGQQ